jgi:hypothetical protein
MIYRKILEYAQALNLNGDAKARTLEWLGTRDIPSVKYDLSLIRQKLTAEQLKQRTLSCAVWTDDAAQFARANDKIDAIHRAHAAKVLANAVDLQKWLQFSTRHHLIPSLPIDAASTS